MLDAAHHEHGEQRCAVARQGPLITNLDHEQDSRQQQRRHAGGGTAPREHNGYPRSDDDQPQVHDLPSRYDTDVPCRSAFTRSSTSMTEGNEGGPVVPTVAAPRAAVTGACRWM